MFNDILFVCVGNVCRSPMAAGFFREQMKNKPFLQISSAGLYALVGKPAVLEARNAMLSLGIDISKHRARQLTHDILANADLILVMERWQQEEIELIFSHFCGKVQLLGKWSGFEILDPYLGSAEDFSYCLKLIERGWQDWRERLI